MGKSLEFGNITREPDIRHAKDMAEVIIDKNWLKDNQDAELYYMYRDLWKNEDKEKINSENLRYDITVIPPREMGMEYVKTKGHYHPEAAEGVTYPEIYEVLEGKAHYLLQKKESKKAVEDVALMETEAGEKALIPPGYGHITINPTDEPLKMSNWVDASFDSTYGDIVEMEGGAYYELVGGNFVENPNYDQLPEIRKAEPTELPEVGIKTGENMYNLIQEPENLDFLRNPQDYESLFDQVL